MKYSMTGMAAALVLGGLATVATVETAFAQSVEFQTGQKDSEIMSGRLVGTRVFNAKGEVIGQIADIVLDANGQAKTVVIGPGGLASIIGVGSKLVGVPFSAVKIGPVVESSRVVLLDLSKDQLDKAPAYKGTDPDRIARGKQKAGEWAKMAKDKAIALSQEAGAAVKGMSDKMTAPKQ